MKKILDASLRMAFTTIIMFVLIFTGAYLLIAALNKVWFNPFGGQITMANKKPLVVKLDLTDPFKDKEGNYPKLASPKEVLSGKK